MTNLGCGCLALVAMAYASPSAFAASFVAVTWDDPPDHRDGVHLLDQNLADVGSFSTAIGLPDGVATAGNHIWVGSFTSREVIAYSFSGAEQFHWSLPDPFALQALDYAGNGQLLAMDAQNNTLVRLDAFTGAVLGSVPAVSDSTEAIAIDGLNVWQLTDQNIYLTRLSDGAMVGSIPNAARTESFEGTAMASVGDSLVLGADSGNWYRVSKLDGSVLASGNNGLSMFDLQPASPLGPSVPDAGGTGLTFALASLALGLSNRHNRKQTINQKS